MLDVRKTPEDMENGYRRMVAVCRDAAEAEFRVRHPVPSLPVRRRMAEGIVTLLDDCATARGGCLGCGELKPCTSFYDQHFSHNMEDPNAQCQS